MSGRRSGGGAFPLPKNIRAGLQIRLGRRAQPRGCRNMFDILTSAAKYELFLSARQNRNSGRLLYRRPEFLVVTARNTYRAVLKSLYFFSVLLTGCGSRFHSSPALFKGFRLQKKHTTLDTAIRISDALGLPLDSLVGDDHMTEKVDLMQHILKSIDWFQTLSAADQEEVLFHFRKILELACK